MEVRRLGGLQWYVLLNLDAELPTSPCFTLRLHSLNILSLRHELVASLLIDAFKALKLYGAIEHGASVCYIWFEAMQRSIIVELAFVD